MLASTTPPPSTLACEFPLVRPIPLPPPSPVCGSHEFVSRATLTTRLSDHDPEVRVAALGQCCRSRYRDDAMVIAMKALLTDDEPEVRAAAATAVPQVAWSPEVCGQLLQILRDDEPVVRTGAVIGLAHGGSPAAIEGVRDALGDGDAAVRVAAIRRLGARMEADPMPELGLALALRDPVARVRVAALHAIAQRTQDDKQTVTELLTRLESLASNPIGLAQATELRRTLESIRTLRDAAQSCWKLTMALTNHSHPLVRSAAMGAAPVITTSGTLNRGGALLRLVEALTDPVGAVRLNAQDNLARSVPHETR